MSVEQLTAYFTAICESFGRCPTTGKVVFATKGDDKAFCGCGQAHLARRLAPATAEDMARQFHSERIWRSGH